MGECVGDFAWQRAPIGAKRILNHFRNVFIPRRGGEFHHPAEQALFRAAADQDRTLLFGAELTIEVTDRSSPAVH